MKIILIFYTKNLNIAAEKLFISMRVYSKSPRKEIGWKTFVNISTLNNSFKINKGLRLRHQSPRDLLILYNLKLSTLGLSNRIVNIEQNILVNNICK